MISLFFVVHNNSGAKTYANELLGYLSTIPGIKVYKIFLDSRSYHEYTEIHEGNILTIHVPTVKDRSRSLMKYAARCVDIMAPILQNSENIIYHLNYGTQVKFGINARNRFGGKVVYTLHYLHDSFYQQYLNSHGHKPHFFMDTLDKEIMHEADRIICISKFSQQAICERNLASLEKTEVIYNGFGTKTIQPLRCAQHMKESLGFSNSEKLILFAGRLLGEEKGVYVLIEAFKKVIESGITARLILTNDGDFGDIMARCRDIFGRVIFTGRLPKEKLKLLYSIADLGVVPSNFELLGYVPIEMMLYGLPIVISDVPGMNELVEDGTNGLKCDVRTRTDGSGSLEVDVDSLAANMKLVLTDELLAKRLASNARKHWENNYTAGHMGMCTLQSYKMLLNGSKQTADLGLRTNT